MRGPTAPGWVRALLALDRGAQALARLVSVVRDEVLFAWVPPSRRAELTAALYAGQTTYAPGGGTFRAGLFDWERALIEMPPFPRTGRLLVGGAGGGREAVALRDRGYEVVAFEPVAALVRAGVPAVAERPGALLIRASYDDLVRAARGEPSPLAPALAAAGVDGVVLGWGSLGHVTEEEDRVALLRAVRAIAPAAPVILSFTDALAPDPRGSRTAALRRGLRRLFAALGAPARYRPGDRFTPWGGFSRDSDAAAIETLARSAAYDVVFIASNPGRAMLTPGGGERRADG